MRPLRPGALAPAPRPGSRPHPAALAACGAVAVMTLFPSVAGALLSGLALWGLAAGARGGPLAAGERRFLLVCALVPAAYALNMALTGWAMNLLDRPMHLLYAALLALLIARTGLDAPALAAATMVAAGLAGLIAAYETTVAGEARVFGLGGRWNAVPFGNFSLLLGCAALAGGLALRRPGWLAGGAAALLAGLGASILSGSRGGWLAAPVLLVIATLASDDLRRRHRVALAGALLLGALAAFSTSETVRERVAVAGQDIAGYLADPQSLQAMENSSAIRLAMWRWGLERFAEAPLTGIGYANFAAHRERAVAEGRLPAHFGELANLHNEFVSSLAFGGLPSAIAVLAFWLLGAHFFVSRLRSARGPTSRYFATVGLLVIAGSAIFAMTEGLLGTRAGTYALALMLALPAGALCHAERGAR